MQDLAVFISYRRADTGADAGRLYDALRRRFGRDSLVGAFVWRDYTYTAANQ